MTESLKNKDSIFRVWRIVHRTGGKKYVKQTTDERKSGLNCEVDQTKNYKSVPETMANWYKGWEEYCRRTDRVIRGQIIKGIGYITLSMVYFAIDAGSFICRHLYLTIIQTWNVPFMNTEHCEHALYVNKNNITMFNIAPSMI